MSRYKIKITIYTPSVDITEVFKLDDYPSAEEWVKAAKDWIKQ